YTGKYWRKGDRLVADVTVTLGGAPDSASLTVDLPSGLSIDTDKLTLTTLDSILPGRILVKDNSPAARYYGDVVYFDSNSVFFQTYTGTTASGVTVNQAAPITFASGDTINIKYTIPIEGWEDSGNIQDVAEIELSASIASVRDDNPTGTISTTFGGSGTVVFDTVIADEHGLYSNGEFTAKSDKAKIRGQLAVTGTEALDNVVTVAPFVNGTQVTGVAATTKVEGASSKATYVPFDFTLHGLDIGDKVTLKVISD